MMDFAQNMQKCSEYVEALEVERRKIQVFQRELPLCFELVSQAIDACRQQLSSPAAVGTSHDCFNARRQQQSECSEQTSRSGHGPVLEEFIPIKKFESCSSEDGNGGGGDEEEEEDESGEKSGKKSDWLRSVQLWNQSPDPADPVPEVKKNGGAFSPFGKEKVGPKDIEVVGRRPVEDKPASSTTVKSRKEESSKVKDNGQTTQRKQRRCWSPELHRRFIHSLQQLGGPHVATPKQIKELMKVDGLTNDEVKSHLQKYRLHMRRPSATMASSSNTQGPHFLVVGGIWVPPSDCPAAGATAVTVTSSADQGEPDSARKKDRTPSNGVYAPVASIGTPFARPALSIQNRSQKTHSRSHCEDDGSHSAHGGARGRCSSSPTSSSSTHTTAVATASPGSA